jgi:hypothetical protein
MNSVRKLLFVGLLVMLPVCLVAADTLEMRDGRVIHGKYMGGTQNNIRFEVNGKTDLYPVADVATLTIDRADHPAAGAAAPQAAPPAEKSPGLQRRPSALTVPPGTESAPRGSVTVPAGTRLVVRMIDGVDSDTAHVGDRFHASLVEDLVVDSTLVAPKDTDVYGRLTEAKQAGRIQGQSELRLELTDIMMHNQLQPIQTGDYQEVGQSRGKDTAKKTVGGAALGAVIGGIAGGGKGAAAGAGIGGAVGAGTQVFTHGQKVKVPPETVLDFTLQQPFVARLPSAAR